ncbi:uncharacterized protein C21orf58 homolog isoform X3 [Zonotrichia leucophrys gambelii]|uniref:uncharacterized protein C21orf58 homolog isoform X3 n=1 Tax=Zonotrichia leucophrys gambelii TaxID=257770 RepID=UPI000EAAEB1C|nr:uncharacterized protein C21orf58 homolog isoform X3 [Zonotrichia albicollis]
MMADPSVLDQLTRLKLKLLEKRLENEQENLEKMDLSLPAARNRLQDLLQSALRQRRNLLQELRMPAQPATIIQQLPQPSPVITQIPPAQPLAAPRPGSIKEDMVEMMLMQNAQMHQIMMQNMMLKALPPALLTQPGGAMAHVPQQKDLQLAMKAERPKVPVVHHHHHYPPTGVFPVPPSTEQPWSSTSAQPLWPTY